MIKFTKEEIDLCKQIAEKYRKEIKFGEWFIYEDSDRKSGFSNPTLNIRNFEPSHGYGKNIALWTISDCLEFLRGRKWVFCLKDFGDISHVGLWKGQAKVPQIFTYAEVAKTPLEACLKAVLAVLEEVKK